MNGSEEEFVPEDEEEMGPQLVKSLRNKLKKAVEEKQEYLNGWQRARADFANYKREEASIHSDKEARMKAGVIEALLPALDSLEMALKHNPTKEVELVNKQIQESLKQLGVERVGNIGDPLNHHLHEVLAQTSSDDVDEQAIAEVMRSGYKIGDHVIRAAQVTI